MLHTDNFLGCKFKFPSRAITTNTLTTWNVFIFFSTTIQVPPNLLFVINTSSRVFTVLTTNTVKNHDLTLAGHCNGVFMERSKGNHTEKSVTLNSTFFDTCTWSPSTHTHTHTDPSVCQYARCFHVSPTNRLISYNHRRIPTEYGQSRYITHDRSDW